MEFNLLAFYPGISSSSVLLVLMLATILAEEFRFWPPETKNLKWFAYWSLAGINTVSLIFMAFSDHNSIFLSLIAIVIIIAGVFVTSIAIKQLSFTQTSGIDQRFIETGLYQYSRNPQVLGNLISLLGIVIFNPTTQVILVSAVTGSWLISMVYAEESWLEQKYGEKYEIYRENAPRFI